MAVCKTNRGVPQGDYDEDVAGLGGGECHELSRRIRNNLEEW